MNTLNFSRPFPRFLAVALLCSLPLAGCFDGGSSSTAGGTAATGDPIAAASSVGTPAPAAGGASTAPVLSGTPVTDATAGFPYTFKPAVTDVQGATITFSVTGKPTWATFNAATGELAGTPTTADIGTTNAVTIIATDGQGSSALGPFIVKVGRSAVPVPGVRPPTISGTPATTVTAGTGYSFQAVGADPDGDKLLYSATNLPSWLAINSVNGLLSGTPGLAQVGTYANIVITVTDGLTPVSLPAFTLTVTAPVTTAAAGGGGAGATSGTGGTTTTTTTTTTTATTGSAKLSWAPPTQNTDGSLLNNLAGFKVKYGNSSTALTQIITLPTPSLTSYTVTGLGKGTWYFAVVAYTAGGSESDVSQVVSKTIN
jgi:hypothetical protein